MFKKIKILFCIIIVLILVMLSGCNDKEDDIDPTIKRIKENGVLKVGTSIPYPPFEYEEGDEIIGFDIDIAKLIADKLDVEIEVKNLDFNMTIFENELNNTNVDIIIAALTITVDRSERFLFSNPYLNAGQVIIINEDNDEISEPADLNIKTVGVQNGTTSEDEALKYTGSSSLVITYNNYSEALQSLQDKVIDAIIIDYPAGQGLIKDIEGVKIVGDPFTDELYGVAIKKGESELKNIIDKIFSSGQLKELEEIWF